MKDKYAPEKSKSTDSSKVPRSSQGPHWGELRKRALPCANNDGRSPSGGQTGHAVAKPREAFIIFPTHFPPKNL